MIVRDRSKTMLRRGNAEQTTYPWWHVLLEGLAGVGLGLALIFSPQRTLGTLISLLGIYWLIVSILALITAFLHRGAGQRVTLIARGLVGVAGGLLLVNLPSLATSFPSDLLTNLAGIMGILVGAAGLIQAAKGGGWGAAILGGISMLLGWTLNRITGSAWLRFALARRADHRHRRGDERAAVAASAQPSRRRIVGCGRHSQPNHGRLAHLCPALAALSSSCGYLHRLDHSPATTGALASTSGW